MSGASTTYAAPLVTIPHSEATSPKSTLICQYDSSSVSDFPYLSIVAVPNAADQEFELLLVTGGHDG